VSDIDANRAGHITARQRFLLLRGVASLLFMTGIGLVIAIALGPNLLNAFGSLGIFGGLLVTIFFLLSVVMTVAGGLGVVFVLGDAVLGRVSSVTGAPTLRRVAVRTNARATPFPSAYRYQGQYKYKVMVGDKEFAIDPMLADHLGRDSQKVRVYFAAYSGRLLSLEPLAATAPGG
jgi:hypothetical protein